MMIGKFPRALKEDGRSGQPIHIECYSDQCRPFVILKCIERYPGSPDEAIIKMTVKSVQITSICLLLHCQLSPLLIP
jgi:hypothetical protein